jgi:ankyrin repeat protein
VASSGSPHLSPSELAELGAAFVNVANYESDDPTEKVDPLTYRAPDGDTCLHIAAHQGNLRAVELLIKAGLDINLQGDMGYTPLHYARTPEIVSALLAAGALTSIENDFGTTPIGWSGAGG